MTNSKLLIASLLGLSFIDAATLPACSAPGLMNTEIKLKRDIAEELPYITDPESGDDVKDRGEISCPANKVMSAAKCEHDNCDNFFMSCSTVIDDNGVNYVVGTAGDWGSSIYEGSQEFMCPENQAIVSSRCSGSRCEYMWFKCAPLNAPSDKGSSQVTFKKDECQWMGAFNDEGVNQQLCPSDKFVTGMKCEGKLCTWMSLHCCGATAPACDESAQDMSIDDGTYSSTTQSSTTMAGYQSQAVTTTSEAGYTGPSPSSSIPPPAPISEDSHYASMIDEGYKQATPTHTSDSTYPSLAPAPLPDDDGYKSTPSNGDVTPVPLPDDDGYESTPSSTPAPLPDDDGYKSTPSNGDVTPVPLPDDDGYGSMPSSTPVPLLDYSGYEPAPSSSGYQPAPDNGGYKPAPAHDGSYGNPSPSSVPAKKCKPRHH